MGIVWENTTPSTELPRDFCAEIGPLQLGVVLVPLCFIPSPLPPGSVYFQDTLVINFKLIRCSENVRTLYCTLIPSHSKSPLHGMVSSMLLTKLIVIGNNIDIYIYGIWYEPLQAWINKTEVHSDIHAFQNILALNEVVHGELCLFWPLYS